MKKSLGKLLLLCVTTVAILTSCGIPFMGDIDKNEEDLIFERKAPESIENLGYADINKVDLGDVITDEEKCKNQELISELKKILSEVQINSSNKEFTMNGSTKYVGGLNFAAYKDEVKICGISVNPDNHNMLHIYNDEYSFCCDISNEQYEFFEKLHEKLL